jgi:hypothetical protein
MYGSLRKEHLRVYKVETYIYRAGEAKLLGEEGLLANVYLFKCET